MTPGIVYLVGAGPGDPGLITVRGLDRVRKADVVIYDYLANPIFLNELRPECECIYVGKRGRDQHVPQSEINALLLRKAGEGKVVVRLKGGDPCIFGRGGEEAEILERAGIAFEIVPGVTAGIGAAAYAGIPLTHRDYASDVTFVSGHEVDSDASPVDWTELASRRGTLVIYMGLSTIDEISHALIQGGKDPHTPTAVIRWGTTAEQITVVGTLESIREQVRRAAIKPPALVVIGAVVTLRERLAWFEKKPLFGKRVLLTRSEDQAHETAALFRDEGAHVLSFPTIDIVPVDLKPLDVIIAIIVAIARRGSFDWLVLTSANGVRILMQRFFELGLDSRALSGLKIAAIGEKTAAALLRSGLRADCIPKQYTQEGLLAALEAQGIAGQSVWIAGAREARTLLAEGLEKLGCRVEVTAVYDTRCPKKSAFDFRNTAIDWIVFTSSKTVEYFSSICGDDAFNALLERGAKIACIGTVTRDTIAAMGRPCHVMPERATIEALLQAMIDYEKRESSRGRVSSSCEP